MRRTRYLLPLPLLLASLGLLAQDERPFAPSLMRTPTGKPADPDHYFEAKDCGECHKDQYEEWDGSLHSRSHTDSIYLAFAELARKEVGEDLYRFCSSCHAPLAVATGKTTPAFLKEEGVTCDVCHHIGSVDTVHAEGGANASFLLEGGDVRYGPLADPSPTPAHESAFSPSHRSARLCSACHTLIHPTNGLVIENTYEEWSKSPYAAAGIQCQDCHMRTPEQAQEVARTMRPVAVPGRTLADGGDRPDVHRHTFAGASTDVAHTGGGSVQAGEAERRLQGAVELALDLPREMTTGGTFALGLTLTNVGAGHAIPTSITELRQVWIDLRVTDAQGAEVFRSGAVDGDGRVDPRAVMYNAILVDEEGKVVYRPWRAARMEREKLLPPKKAVHERWEVDVPAGAKGPLTVEATLRYRAAPQEVMDQLFGKGRFDLRIVDMASAKAAVPITR